MMTTEFVLIHRNPHGDEVARERIANPDDVVATVREYLLYAGFYIGDSLTAEQHPAD